MPPLRRRFFGQVHHCQQTWTIANGQLERHVDISLFEVGVMGMRLSSTHLLLCHCDRSHTPIELVTSFFVHAVVDSHHFDDVGHDGQSSPGNGGDQPRA